MSATRPRVLLLNPPGQRLYLRDYYCSKTSKAGYLYEPVDLLILSGLLNAQFDLSSLDAIAEGLRPESALDRIAQAKPDAVIGLIGAVSLTEDLDFYKALKSRLGIPILLSGDAVMDGDLEFLAAHPFIDAVLLDFTDPEVIRWLNGERIPFRAITWQSDGRVTAASRQRHPEFAIGLPRHDLFASPAYRFPFVRRRRFATVLTDYGCPWPCNFCIMGELTFKTRAVDSVMAELESLVAAGIREIYFDDQTFGVKPERTAALCKAMAALRPPPGWVAFTRADLVTPDRLALYREAGCHTLMLGVETADQALLDRAEKKLKVETIREAFALCRKAGIRTVATFLFGLPGETDAQREATIQLARTLGCDYASFNVAVPRSRTGLRDGAQGDWARQAMDQSGHAPGWQEGQGDAATWIRRANLAFYLRPGYLLRRTTAVRSWEELAGQARFALGLLRAGRPLYEVSQ